MHEMAKKKAGNLLKYFRPEAGKLEKEAGNLLKYFRPRQEAGRC
jgi:hypothetical protein